MASLYFYERRLLKHALSRLCLLLGIDPEYFYRLGMKAMGRRKVRRALAAFRIATTIDPEFVVAWYGRAMARTECGDFGGAIAEYGEGLRLAPIDSSAHESRGHLYRQLGDVERAMADYNEAIRLEPIEPVRRQSRGDLLLDLGKADLAIHDYSEAVRADPQFATAYLMRAIAYHYLGDYRAAIADYTKAIEVDARYVFSLAVSGLVFGGAQARAKQPIGPLRYRPDIRLEPCEATAFYNRGLAYHELGDFAPAFADFKKAAAFDPTYLTPDGYS